MANLAFSKMHGLGNCFIIMDDRRGEVSAHHDIFELAKKVCDRSFGIGADGLLLVQTSDKADFRYRIINEDGSEAEMCGNGIRCFARYIADKGLSDKVTLAHETLAGVIETTLLEDGRVEVDMGEPVFDNGDVRPNVESLDGLSRVEADGHSFSFVSMGNPHAVAFVRDVPADWLDIGARVENSPQFPNRTNVEFVKKISDTEVEVKVWERGCGATMACGTGACAVAVAGIRQKELSGAPVTVHLPGGSLQIAWDDRNHVMMTGPAAFVCEGTYFAD